mgnify:CR=1 FL=1|jgi:predicted phosphate transport protein (TIGR00153 family)
MKNKQKDYFEAFYNHAELSCKAAKEVADTLENFDSFALPEAVERVHKIENQADIVKRELVAALSKEFLPPIEREDIMQLVDQLDNVTDSVEDVLRGIYTYNITSIKPEAIEFVRLICDICLALKETVEDFKDFKKSSTLQGRIIRVNDLEVEGDKLFTQAMRNLFVNACDPRELLVWQNIFTSLEVCCDNCEHVADAIEAAVLKNS